MKRVLYPSNWLFNAGVIGLLRLLKEMGMDVNKLFKDNYVEIDLKDDEMEKLLEIVYIEKGKSKQEAEITEQEDKQDEQEEQENEQEKPEEKNDKIEVPKLFLTWKDLSLERSKIINYQNEKALYGKQKAYFSNKNEEKIAEAIKWFFQYSNPQGSIKCPFCFSDIEIEEISPLNQGFMKLLLGTSSFPNAFYNCNLDSVFACKYCSFILFCHLIGFNKFNDNELYFINADSFETMWNLSTIGALIDNLEKNTQLLETYNSYDIVYLTYDKQRKGNKEQKIKVRISTMDKDGVRLLSKAVKNVKDLDLELIDAIVKKDLSYIEGNILRNFKEAKESRKSLKALDKYLTSYYLVIEEGKDMDDIRISLQKHIRELKTRDSGWRLIGAIQDDILRYLELVKLGRRNELIYKLTRTYSLYKERLGDSLSYVLFDEQDEEKFKFYMYSYLKEFINPKKEVINDESERNNTND